MDTIKIKTAIESDMESINNFIETHFVAIEPIINSYQLKTPTSESMNEIDEGMNEFYLECIRSQTTFIAYSSEKRNDLVGVLVGGKINPNHYEETLEFANSCKDKTFADFSKLLGYVEKKADVCTRLGVEYSLHIHMISVHKDYLKRGIASRMFGKCIEEAKNLDFPSLSLDCTSHYTSIISEKYGLKLLSTVTYDEFNEHVGEKLFTPKEPHTLIRSYGISLK